jgi:hypothetical protein
MHWVIDVILIAGMIYLAYQVETARAEIRGVANLVIRAEQRDTAALANIDEQVDAIAQQLNTPGTRHWTPPEDAY